MSLLSPGDQVDVARAQSPTAIVAQRMVNDRAAVAVAAARRDPNLAYDLGGHTFTLHNPDPGIVGRPLAAPFPFTFGFPEQNVALAPADVAYRLWLRAHGEDVPAVTSA